MIYYDLCVTKVEPNPDYDKQYKEYQEMSRYGGYQSNAPQPEREMREIKARLTEMEYEAVKRALLEVWK